MRLPDQYIGWSLFALRHAVAEARQPGAIIVASLPIYTNAVVGYIASKDSGAPLVLDFRDAWTDDPYLHVPTRFHKAFHRFLERKVLSHAKAFTVCIESHKSIFEERYEPTNATVILNGFDDADFIMQEPAAKSEKLRLVYSGTIFPYHDYFIELLFTAVSRLSTDHRDSLELIFIGDIQLGNFDKLVEAFNLAGIIERKGYLSHGEAISYIKSSDALLFTVPQGDMVSYTGKIFEYLGARVPIISVCEATGAAGRMLEKFGHGPGVSGFDSDEIVAALTRLIQGGWAPSSNPEHYALISRSGQAQQLAGVIRSVR